MSYDYKITTTKTQQVPKTSAQNIRHLSSQHQPGHQGRASGIFAHGRQGQAQIQDDAPEQ